MDGDSYLPSDDLLSEHAYLVARGVRPLALVGLCPAEPLVMTRIATRVEGVAEQGAIPFVVDQRDGTASYGYAAARWVLDLYEWAIAGEQIPQEQRERILGLLLGYSVAAVSEYEDEAPRRRFLPASASPGSASS
jgi:hypothetical protein